jgi:hypothetical protein
MAKNKFKVFGVPWHTSHQYNLAKLSFIESYDLLTNPYRSWSSEARPQPDNVNFVTHYEPGKYDFAILHLDQQAIYDPEEGQINKIARLAKGRLYYEVNKEIQDIPKIVINHMTPFHDHIESVDVVRVMKKMVGDNFMIVNSYTAAKQWGWGKTVTHGLEASDWQDLPKEPRCVTVLGRGGMEKAYRRVFLHATARLLLEMKVPFYWIGNDTNFRTPEEYKDFLGRSLVFFMPTWQSPRPRARTEAMLSGCCVVSTPYQDADTFIEDGKNGFLTSKFQITDPRVMDNPQRTAELIKRLVLDEPELALKIGQEGKKTAKELFNFQNFEKQWVEVLKEVGVWK